MDATKWLTLCSALNMVCWVFILKIMQRGWQRHIKNLALRRFVTISATAFALPTTIIWSLAIFMKAVWDQIIYPAACDYAELTGIRKEDV